MHAAPKRIGLRALFSYWLLYTISTPFYAVRLQAVGGAIDSAQSIAAVWFGKNVLGITRPIPIQPTGSGDTMLAYVSLVLLPLVAIILAVTWWALDRKRDNDARVKQWMLVYMRYTLAIVMFGYGLAKVFPSQFPPLLSPERLVETMGEYSPMGLLWTFMSFSPAYTIFAGIGETLGGALLCFKRTATLGALVSAAVMTNVAALNYMYDVPVKLYSSHLVFAALVIAAADFERLSNVLVFNRNAAPRPADPPLWRAPKVQLAMTMILTVIVLVDVGFEVKQNRGFMNETVSFAKTAPIYGIYEIEEWRRNGEVVPPLLTDTTRWRRIAFGQFNRAVVRPMAADTAFNFRYSHNDTTGTIRFVSRLDTLTFAFAHPDSLRLELRGKWRGDSVSLRLVRSTRPRLLTSRGYNWVQELPFNR
jgi:hypothetical protein